MSRHNIMSVPVFQWIVQLILLFYVLVVAANRHCVYNDALTAANCSNMDLDHIPWRLHKIINVLDLSSNSLSVLQDHSFIDYPSIRELYLRNNSMQNLKTKTFKGLSFLSKLDFSNNKLTHVPMDAIDVVSNSLRQLILAGNKLSKLAEGTFSRLHKLELLDLSGNSIYTVEPGAFAKLSSLTVLKLRHNAIKMLPENEFQDFPRASMVQVQLYENRWICDCHSRWLWQWLNDTDVSVWESPGYAIRCEGPGIVRDEALNELPWDKLVCQAKMKISGSTRVLAKDGNTTLQCQYWSVPKTRAVWAKNSEEIDVRKDKKKFQVTSWDVKGKNDTYASELTVRNFKYSDIARYKCLVENIRGVDYTEYKLTLQGVDFNSVMVVNPVGQKAGDATGVDTRSIVIAVAVVCGIILIIVIAVLIFCSVNRMQRKKQAKRDVIVQHVKEHFIKNSEDITMDPTGKSKQMPLVRKLEDGTGSSHTHSNQEDNRSCSNHTNDSTYKAPLDMDEAEPMLIMADHSPGSPLNNGNTYVSFGSEFADPGEFPSQVPVYHPQHTPSMSSRYGPNGRAGGPPHSGGSHSHEGSATPLLDRYTPVFGDDSDEPLEDYASYPIYDSLTNSLQHPRLTPPLVNGSIYNNGGSEGMPVYGSSPMHPGGVNNPHYRPQPGSFRNGALDRSLGSSSFNYPNSNSAGSLPRTPGSVRSVAAVPPWNSGPGDHSPPIIESHYQPPPLVHRPNPEYRDYRDMRYPPPPPPQHTQPQPPLLSSSSSSTPPHYRTDGNSSAGGGGRNRAYSPAPSSGPRKPPRVYIPDCNGSRDGSELTTPGSGYDSSDYITSAEAQQYSQNYGITPGTPV